MLGSFLLVLAGNQEPDKELELIRQAIADRPDETHSGPLELTTSIGATTHLTEQQLNSLTYKKHLKAADDALYQAKQSGRNKVVIS